MQVFILLEHPKTKEISSSADGIRFVNCFGGCRSLGHYLTSSTNVTKECKAKLGAYERSGHVCASAGFRWLNACLALFVNQKNIKNHD